MKKEKHECCEGKKCLHFDGECNHDDCCGKISENCPLLDNKPVGYHPDPNGDLKFIYKKARELVDTTERLLKNKDV